jgi:protein-S-isoprenylcysteine O-methyltransferase Ste14
MKVFFNMTAESSAIDRVHRSPRRVFLRRGDLLACFAFGLMSTFQAFSAAGAASDSDWLGAANYSVVALALGVCAFLTLLRGPALLSRIGWRTRAIAVIGNFAVIPLAGLPLTWRPDWLMTVTMTAGVLVYCWVIWALLTLKRGFSVFPEARILVTSGPYAIVRHPLYAAYLIVYGLIALPRISALAVLFAMLGIASELMRAKNEEHVLRAAFQKYDEYAINVPGFVPRLARQSGRRSTTPDARSEASDSDSRELAA